MNWRFHTPGGLPFVCCTCLSMMSFGWSNVVLAHNATKYSSPGVPQYRFACSWTYDPGWFQRCSMFSVEFPSETTHRIRFAAPVLLRPADAKNARTACEAWWIAPSEPSEEVRRGLAASHASRAFRAFERKNMKRARWVQENPRWEGIW